MKLKVKKGVYFKEDKSFQLQETQIIYTKSEAPIILGIMLYKNELKAKE